MRALPHAAPRERRFDAVSRGARRARRYHHRRARKHWLALYANTVRLRHGEASSQHIAAAKAAAEAAGIHAPNVVHIEPLQHTSTIARWRAEAAEVAANPQEHHRLLVLRHAAAAAAHEHSVEAEGGTPPAGAEAGGWAQAPPASPAGYHREHDNQLFAA